jgi:hypothetical protein
MNEVPSQEVPAREFYTAQEIVDLALEWGANPTLVDDGGEVVVELERADSSMHLDLGPPSQFYEDFLCRSWIFVPASPHRFCDRWNRFPYFGAFSVAYDANEFPERTEAGFVIRAVRVVEFDRFRKEQDIFRDVLLFWCAIDLIQRGVSSGEADPAHLRAAFVGGGFTRWWFGEE